MPLTSITQIASSYSGESTTEIVYALDAQGKMWERKWEKDPAYNQLNADEKAVFQEAQLNTYVIGWTLVSLETLDEALAARREKITKIKAIIDAKKGTKAP